MALVCDPRVTHQRHSTRVLSRNAPKGSLAGPGTHVALPCGRYNHVPNRSLTAATIWPIQRLRPMSPRVWTTLRAASMLAALGLCVVATWWPALSLALFWRVVVPLLPLVFLAVPGLWRNICPMA